MPVVVGDKVPDVGLDVALMLNRDDVPGSTLVTQILDACLSNLEPTATASDRPFARGTFVSPGTGRVITLLCKSGMQVVSIDGFDWSFVSEEDGVLRPSPIWNHMKLEVDLDGDPANPSAIRLNDFGNIDALVAVRLPDSLNPARITGHYRSKTVSADATIRAAEGGVTLKTTGRFGSVTYHLDCVADGIWRARSGSTIPWDAILTFKEDGGEFNFTTMRTKSLSFDRNE